MIKSLSIIELKNVYKRYRIGANFLLALNNVNLTIKKGELAAIIGPSGSGKSTIMNVIGLLDKPSNGEYWLAKREVSKLSANELAELRNEQIGFVFQSFFLLPKLTALENAALPLTYRRLPQSKIQQMAYAMLAKVSIAHLAKHKPNQLSGGQQQRVAIARALITQPNIILADEPTGNLDSKTGQEVMDLLLSINQQEGATIILVTHDSHIAGQCQRQIKIQDGCVQ